MGESPTAEEGRRRRLPPRSIDAARRGALEGASAPSPRAGCRTSHSLTRPPTPRAQGDDDAARALCEIGEHDDADGDESKPKPSPTGNKAGGGLEEGDCHKRIKEKRRRHRRC